MALALVSAAAGAQVTPPRRVEIPAAYRPPVGLCRVWVDGVPAKKQPAPTDCATALRNKPSNGRVIFGETLVQPPSRDVRRLPDSSPRVPPVQPGSAGRVVPPDSLPPRRDSTGTRRDTTRTTPVRGS